MLQSCSSVADTASRLLRCKSVACHLLQDMHPDMYVVPWCCRVDDNTIVAVVIPENAGPAPSKPPVRGQVQP
jgi:hypothetical protein